MGTDYMSGYYRYCVTLMKLAYINLLWILFTILGLGILGVAPATVAMLNIIRGWIRGDTEEPILKTFWQTYKKEFVKANMLGITYIFVGIILYVDIVYFSNPSSIMTLILYYFFWVVTIIYILLGLFMFPVYVHYENKWWQYFKSTLLVMAMNPLTAFAFVIVVGAMLFILRLLPGLIPFYSVSIIAYLIMLLSFRAFIKVDTHIEKQQIKALKMAESLE